MNNNQPPFALHQSPGSGKRHCDPWGDPKTAVAPLPRAPLHQLPTTNPSRFTSRLGRETLPQYALHHQHLFNKFA
ncbi:MAG: hypothetical protein ACHBN1_04395 [Heteroscytonema crispum UTEX LB 1556]